jgi:hypothetical protein
LVGSTGLVVILYRVGLDAPKADAGRTGIGIWLVLSLVLPLIGYLFPRHVEEKRLTNALNEELNEFLMKNEGRIGWARSYWGAGENSATFHVYGAVEEGQQTAVLNWLAAVKAERHLRLSMEVKFYEDYRRVSVGRAKLLKTVHLSDAGPG